MSKRPTATGEETKTHAPLKRPKRPKKPQSAYMIFSTVRRQEIKKSAKIPGADLTEQIGREWKDMDATLKQTYKTRAETMQNQYKKDLESFEKANQDVEQEIPKRKPKPLEDGGKRKKQVRS